MVSLKTSKFTTDIDRKSQNLRYLYRGMEFQLGVFRFSYDQNNHDLSGAYVLRSERWDKHARNAAWCKKIVDACCLCLFLRVVGKNPNTFNWCSMADDAITQSGIGVLESPFYICEVYQTYISFSQLSLLLFPVARTGSLPMQYFSKVCDNWIRQSRQVSWWIQQHFSVRRKLPAATKCSYNCFWYQHLKKRKDLSQSTSLFGSFAL